MTSAGYLILVVAVLPVAVSASDSELDDARLMAHEYVESADGCAFADGYVCIPPANEDFLDIASQNQMISGNLMKAWLSALEKFQNEPWHSEASRDLKHYKIGITESDDHYVVLFQGLLLPRLENGEFSGYLTETLGKTTRYWISKQSFEVERQLYYK